MAHKKKKKLKNKKNTVGIAKIAAFTTNSISSAFSNYKKNKELNKIKIDKKLINFKSIEKDFLKLTKDKTDWHHFLSAMIESFFNNSYQEKKELKFWAEKILVPKNIGIKKKFWVEKNLGYKKIRVNKI